MKKVCVETEYNVFKVDKMFIKQRKEQQERPECTKCLVCGKPWKLNDDIVTVPIQVTSTPLKILKIIAVHKDCFFLD